MLHLNWIFKIFFLTRWEFPLLLSGGQQCGGAGADGSERKQSPAEERGAASAARELYSQRGQEVISMYLCSSVSLFKVTLRMSLCNQCRRLY